MLKCKQYYPSLLPAIAVIGGADAHMIPIAHGHSPISPLSPFHIHFLVISYTYTALVLSFHPSVLCLCGGSLSSDGKRFAGQTGQTRSGRL